MLRAIRVLAITTLVALLPGVAAAKWTKLSSANFVFVGDAPAGQIRRVAERLEQFREVMTRALPGATATSPVPTIVVVFASERSLNPVRPLFRGNATEVGGYLQTGEDLNYIVINGEYIDTALLTVFHEYAHLLVGNTIGGPPAWLSEGLAEFYEMMQGVDGGKSVDIGRAPIHHIELLKNNTPIPIKQLLTIDHDSPVYHEGSRRGVFYAQSWALTHYLTLGNKERGSQFRQYLTALRSGTDHQVAFTAAFGSDTAALDRELFDYIRKYLFPALRVDFGEKIVADIQRGTTIDDVEGEIYVADLQARIGRDEEARTKLQAIVIRTPDAALAWTSLGLIEFRERRIKEALPLLERGAERGEGNAFVQTALGRALIAAYSEASPSERSTEILRQARAALAKAVELDANSSFASGMLGYVELALGSDLPRAVSLLTTAVRLAPSREQYRLMLARALMEQRDYAAATNHLGALMATGRSADTRDDARRLLADVADARIREASGTRAAAENERRPPLGPIGDVAPPPRRSRVRLDLRAVQSGETRTLGQFRAIECTRDLIVLQVDANGRTLRLAAKQMSEVDFITYRADTAGSVSCGPLPAPLRAFVTYRMNATTTASGMIDGDAVAIELLPDDYQPEPTVR